MPVLRSMSRGPSYFLIGKRKKDKKSWRGGRRSSSWNPAEVVSPCVVAEAVVAVGAAAARSPWRSVLPRPSRATPYLPCRREFSEI